MSKYFGDIAEDGTIEIPFNTYNSDGASVTFTGTTVKVYKDSATGTEVTTGVTLSKDHDGITGAHLITIVATDAFYATGSDYLVELQAATIDSQTVNSFIGSFSIQHRYNEVSLNSTSQASVVDDVWDELLTGTLHNIATSAGRRLRQINTPILLDGTSPDSGGTANTLTRIELDGDASAVDGTYDPGVVSIYEGTGTGQSRQIFEYDGSNKYAYINRDWKVIPDNTSKYIVISSAGDTHINEGVATGGGASTITLNALADNVNDDIYKGQVVFIVAGTGQDQANRVASYVASTRIATMDTPWVVEPVAGSIYAMLPIQGELMRGTDGAATEAKQDAGDIVLARLALIQESDRVIDFGVGELKYKDKDSGLILLRKNLKDPNDAVIDSPEDVIAAEEAP